jgi:hypothetical protein
MSTDDDQPLRERSLTIVEAYDAAERFVAQYYDREPVEPLFRLLLNMSLTSTDCYPPRTTDPASWSDWERCVQEMLDGEPLPEWSPPPE